MSKFIFFVAILFYLSRAQLMGTIKKNSPLPLVVKENGVKKVMYVTIDANWRWVHAKDSTENCYSGSWNKKFCPDAEACSKNCMLEGVDQNDYLNTYGVSTQDSSLTLRYITKHTYGENVGSRLYLLDETGKQYKGFDFTNQQFSFTADMSKVPCGMNGAIYSVEMPTDGGLNRLNQAGAPYGTGYGDAQCAKDMTWVSGFANLNQTGSCSVEMDFWEANRMATAFTPHTCSTKGTQHCHSPLTCGDGSNRYKGWCDKDGADYNPYRLGQQMLYGPSDQHSINTLKPFQVITQFTTKNNQLESITRFYRQSGKVVFGGELTDQWIQNRKSLWKENNHFATLGGMKGMQSSFSRKHVLAISLWDDVSVNMLWLDSTFPAGSSQPGALRGPCSGKENNPEWMRKNVRDAQVIYSNFEWGPIENLLKPSVAPSRSSSQPPIPTRVPVSFSQNYWSCKLCDCQKE